MAPTNDRAAMNQYRPDRNATLGQSGLSFRYRGLHEIVHPAPFKFVIDPSTGSGFAPIANGLALTLIHLISIPVTNTSVNPARSTSQALFVGGWALEQLWLFWVAPIAGALIGALAYTLFLKQER